MNSAKIIKLGQIANVIAGQSPESKFYSNQGVPFLQGNKTFGHLYPAIDTYTTKITKLAEAGDILISVRAPVGDLNIASMDLCIGRGLAAIQPREVSSEFIYYSLKHNLNTLLKKQSGGTTFSSVNKSDLEDLDLVVPSINQHGIKASELLWCIDQKILTNNKINAELEQAAQLIYDYWFTQFDFPDAQGKPYKSSGGAMVMNDQLKRKIPVGWRAIALRDLLHKRTESAEPDAKKRCIDMSVMPSSSVSLIGYNRGDTFSSNMKKMYKGDILFGGIRPYLKKAGIAPFDGLRAGTVHAFYPKNLSDYNLCSIIMTSERFFEYAIVKSGGNTRMPTVSADDILDYSLAYSEAQATEYQNTLPTLFQLIVNNVVESQELAHLRDWLLPMLMTGQVSVKS